MRAALSILPGLLLALASWGPAQTSLEEAEIEYSRGLYALNAGRLDEAASRFRAATEIHPQGWRYWYELARVENLRKDHSEAASVLERARGLGLEIQDLSYHLGVALLGEGRLEEARARLEEARQEDPRHAPTHLYLGLAEEGLGNPAAAVAHYERAASLDPGLRDEADLFSGRVYLGEGMQGEARAALEAAARSEDEQIVRLSRDYLERFEERSRGRSPRWSLSAFLATEYDDNVTLNPEDPDVDDFPEAGRADLRAVALGRVLFRPLQGERSRIGLGYSIYRSRHDTLRDFDIEGHLPEVFYAYRGGPFRMRLGYGLEYYDVGGDDYLRRHEGELRLGPGARPGGRTDVILRYRGDTYFDNPDRDAVEWAYGVEQYFFPWSDKGRHLGLHAEVADRDSGNDYARKEREAGISYFTPLGVSWDFFVSLTYTEFDYRNVDSFFHERRDDEEWQLVLRSTWDLSEALALLFQVRVTSHPSNIDFYDYNQRSLSVGVLARY